MSAHIRFQNYERADSISELDVRSRAMFWRGECMDAFSRAEAAVSRTLSVISASASASKMKIPPPAGARYKTLVETIQANGILHQQGIKALKALHEWSEIAISRAWIAHGIFSVKPKSYGWRLDVEFSRIEGKIFVPQPQRITSEQAKAILREMSNAADRLCCQLGQVDREIRSVQI